VYVNIHRNQQTFWALVLATGLELPAAAAVLFTKHNITFNNYINTNTQLLNTQSQITLNININKSINKNKYPFHAYKPLKI